MLKAVYPSAWKHYVDVIRHLEQTINADVPQRRAFQARAERLEMDLMLLNPRKSLATLQAEARKDAKTSPR